MSVTISKGHTFVDSEKITPTKINDAFDDATVDGLGTMATQNNDEVNIVGGNANLSVLTVDRLTDNLEEGYPVSGSIPLVLSNQSGAYLNLTDNATFSISAAAKGMRATFVLKNSKGGGASITLAWPAWTQAVGTTLPTTLASGAVLRFELYAIGTTTADVIASQL
jgi:hypothetical protein